MPNYRLYFMSAQNGHINRFADYEAPDDEAAMALAGEQEGASPLELWCGHRKVGRIEPADPVSWISPIQLEPRGGGEPALHRAKQEPSKA